MLRLNTSCTRRFTLSKLRVSSGYSRHVASIALRTRSSTPCGPSTCRTSEGDLLVSRNASHVMVMTGILTSGGHAVAARPLFDHLVNRRARQQCEHEQVRETVGGGGE